MATLYVEYGLQIRVADQGEGPLPGMFFAPNAKWTLSKIASKAYNDSSAWKIINRNAWNVDHLVYRADSTKCTSERRASALANTTVSPVTSKTSAYISLCQRDASPVFAAPAVDFRFPVIWIPDLDRMPLPVKPEERKEEPETIPVTPGSVKIDVPTGPSAPSGPSAPTGPGAPTGPSAPSAPASKEKMAGIGLVLGGLALLGALFVLPTSGGKKRKGKRR